MVSLLSLDSVDLEGDENAAAIWWEWGEQSKDIVYPLKMAEQSNERNMSFLFFMFIG